MVPGDLLSITFLQTPSTTIKHYIDLIKQFQQLFTMTQVAATSVIITSVTMT